MYVDTNIVIAAIKKEKLEKLKNFFISSFSIFEIVKVLNSEFNLSSNKIEKILEEINKNLKILEIEKVEIEIENLIGIAKIIKMDKSFLNDFIHLKICEKNNLKFLTKDKKLIKLIQFFPFIQLLD